MYICFVIIDVTNNISKYIDTKKGIIEEEQLPIVCRLGGFHTFMSFLGSVGVLMNP